MDEQPATQQDEQASANKLRRAQECAEAAIMLGSVVLGGTGRIPPRDPSNPDCPACPDSPAQKETPPKDLGDCKNGSLDGKCVPDKDVKESCYVIMQGGTCAAKCTVLDGLGQCVKRCGIGSCTEYLNRTSSKYWSDRTARFVYENGGKQAAICAAAGGGFAVKAIGVLGPVGKGIQGLGAGIGAGCTFLGGNNGAKQAIALEEIGQTGGCLTYNSKLGYGTWGIDNSTGFCTNG